MGISLILQPAKRLQSGANIDQEPFEYPKHFDNNRQFLTNQGWLYYGALHVTQYFIQLRYSLLQLLYDTMFANQIDGMPIARSMVCISPLVF